MLDIDLLKQKVSEKTLVREQILKSLFQEDFNIYYVNEKELDGLDDTNYGYASQLCDELEPLMERFNTIYTLASDVIAKETKELV